MRILYWIRSKFREWNYKRKYGITIEEGMLEYGRNIILTKKKNDISQ